MTQQELYHRLQSSGYPVAHIEFSTSPTAPYIAYLIEGEEHRGSDDKNLIKESDVKVELYIEYFDTIAENTLDELLGFTQFSKSKTKLSNERLLMILYEFDEIQKL